MSDDELPGRPGGHTETRTFHHRPGLECGPHPLADLFPPMADDEYAQLVEDVREHGLREPVVLFEGKVLDGRHRARACAEAGAELLHREYDGDDPVGFVVSANMRRRHLTDGQRAAIAAELETTDWGGDRKADQDRNCDLDRATASRLLNVHPASTARAAKVRNNAPAEVFDAVKAGTVAPSDAAKIADKPHEVQREALAAVVENPGKTTLAKQAGRVEREDASERWSDPDMLGGLPKHELEVSFPAQTFTVEARSLSEARRLAKERAVRAVADGTVKPAARETTPA